MSEMLEPVEDHIGVAIDVGDDPDVGLLTPHRMSEGLIERPDSGHLRLAETPTGRDYLEAGRRGEDLPLRITGLELKDMAEIDQPRRNLNGGRLWWCCNSH
jgi:hypothetical protein